MRDFFTVLAAYAAYFVLRPVFQQGLQPSYQTQTLLLLAGLIAALLAIAWRPDK